MLLIKKEKEDILSYLEDSSNFKDGNAERVYIPENETELKEVLTDSAKKNIPITISGGGTGTVAGRVPKEGYIVSLEKFNQIININKEDKRATLQSGVIVKDFLQELDPLSMFYPPFPTERTALIGGNAATNASGE